MNQAQIEQNKITDPKNTVGLHILTLMNSSRHHRGGMLSLNSDLSQELRELGCQVENAFIEDLPGGSWGKFDQVAFGLKILRLIETYERRYGPYDVLEISGGDGWAFPLLRNSQAKNGTASLRRLLVARSHGLEHLYWQAHLQQAALGTEYISRQHRLYFGKVRLWLVEQTVRQADLLICHTEATREYVIDRNWKKPPAVLISPGGINEAFFEPTLKPLRPTYDRLLFSGDWSWMKGRTALGQIFSQLAERRPTLKLTIVGCHTPSTEVLGYFPPSLWERITINQSLSRPEMITEFGRHDLLVMPSLFEGYGIVAGEAMAAGLPVVASRVGGIPDLIQDGVQGFSCDPADLAGFVEAIETLLDNPAQAQQIRLAARERVKDLTWRQIAQSTLQAYQQARQNLTSDNFGGQ